MINTGQQWQKIEGAISREKGQNGYLFEKEERNTVTAKISYFIASNVTVSRRLGQLNRKQFSPARHKAAQQVRAVSITAPHDNIGNHQQNNMVALAPSISWKWPLTVMDRNSHWEKRFFRQLAIILVTDLSIHCWLSTCLINQETGPFAAIFYSLVWFL